MDFALSSKFFVKFILVLINVFVKRRISTAPRSRDRETFSMP